MRGMVAHSRAHQGPWAPARRAERRYGEARPEVLACPRSLWHSRAMGKMDNAFRVVYEEWVANCVRLRQAGRPETDLGYLRLVDPEEAAEWEQIIAESTYLEDDRFDPDKYAEIRRPLNYAKHHEGKADKAKRPETKRKYLEAALLWLNTPHPFIGPKVAQDTAVARAGVEKKLADLP